MIRLFHIRIIVLGLILFGGVGVSAQTEYEPDNKVIYDMIEKRMDKVDSEFHNAIKPWRKSEISKYLTKEDSGRATINTTVQLSKNISIIPAAQQQLIFEKFGDSSNVSYFSGLGASLNFNVSRKVHLSLSAYASIFGESYANSHWIDTLGIYPQWAKVEKNADQYSFGQWQGYLTYSPSDIFTFELGKGNHFYGNGIRSLLLTNEVAPYPYLKISSKVWKLQYVNLFALQKHIARQGNKNLHEDKFTASHYLSWNISESVNVQLFETIIWRRKDSLSNRTLDVNYLNPIIFYRPVEFSLGSADNAILGIGINIKTSNKWQLYGHMALDEFFLSELRKGYQWWGNKYGILLGGRLFDPFNIKNLTIQSEFILVRPFTYSHGDPQQNYAHFGQALTHPLGANFYEALFNCTWMKDRWRVVNRFSFSYYGRDHLGSNLGGDIFKSYVNPTRLTGNFIGQGLKHRVYFNEFRIQHFFNRMQNIHAFASFSQWFSNVGGQTQHNFFGSVGISINWLKQEFDFRAAPM